MEICVCPSPDGNGRTYTSFLPDSLEVYAIHCPSGETWPCSVTDGFCRYGKGFRSPDSGSIHTSLRRLAFGSSAYTRNRPSGDHDKGVAPGLNPSGFNNNCSDPLPLDDFS